MEYQKSMHRFKKGQMVTITGNHSGHDNAIGKKAVIVEPIQYRAYTARLHNSKDIFHIVDYDLK